MSKQKLKFLQVYSVLKSELLRDPAFDFTDESRQWLDRMLDYNVPKGKLNRGMCVIDCYRELKEGKELIDDEFFLASALGWCIEWFQAAALVMDDILDSSHMRRGQPCWFRLPKVGMIALNDAVILRNQIARILKTYFREKPYYVNMLDLFNEVEFQTLCGQMIDSISTREEKALSNYSIELYYKITEYKSAYYSMYLPVACALLLAGENLDSHHEVKKILIEITAAYQIRDDFLDCFGDPKLTGKVGTDIEEGKCSWLVVRALECANEEQKKLLYANYGKADPACVAKVKELYKNLHLPEIYAEDEKNIFKALKSSVAIHPSELVKALSRRYAGVAA